MTKQDFAHHITTLAAANDIAVDWRDQTSGRAWRRARKVRLSTVTTDSRYAVALHEVGHILGPMQTGRRLEQEAGAWIWAKANALVWTSSMQAKMSRSLDSYAAWARRRGDKMCVPEAGHQFWDLLGRTHV